MNKGFRPLHGDLIFLLRKLSHKKLVETVFVPSTGILYFYNQRPVQRV